MAKTETKDEQPKQEKPERFEIVEVITQTTPVIKDNQTGEHLSSGDFQTDLLRHICDIKNTLEVVRKQFT